MPLEAGQSLLHYRIVEKLGEGGMGVVWKAEDTKLQRHIGLKVLPEAMAADPDRRARFEREARAVAALNHPNIVTVHSVEQADTPEGPVHFITMELIDGRTLTGLLPKDGLPLGRLLEIAIPLADAVSRAHRAGITHRDLKPDNIMIDEDGRLRVLDFGLAKLQEPAGTTRDPQAATVTSDTAEGRVLGTVAYMSPEQAEGKEVDARSDVFSLGTILYELASGRRPFRGDTTMSTISSILKDEPSSITDLQPSLPRHAGRIIRRCLAKDPNRRYQTALDLRNELEELKTEIDSGVHAAEATGATGPSRRRIKPSIVGGLGLIVMVAAAVIVAIQLRNRSDQALPVKLVPRPVTATTAWDSDSSWSPDGKFIAFTRMKSGNLDIYVQSVDGGQAVARVEGPGDQKHPRWSPDNRYLAYISTETPGSPVFLVPPDGGRSKELISTNVPTLSMAESLGSRPWSNDGASLLVSRVLENGQLAVFRVDVLTGEATQVTFPPAGSVDLRATHSFDGERILFLRGNNLAGRMMVMPAGGEEPEVLSERWATTAVWRSDNQHVLFTLQGGTQQELVEINVDTGESRTVFDAPSLGKVAVSADDRIVYSDFRHDTFLFIVDTETGERRQVTSHTRNNFAPRFSPDGRTIAYTSNRTGAFEVWLHRLDDGNETRLIDGLGANVLPAWSPDGRRIVFSSNREDGEPKWYIANADGGGGARRLIDQAINWQGPTSTVVSTSRWSPGGELISYIVIGDEGGELWTVAPDGEGAQRRLTDITGFDWYTSSRTGLVSRLRGSEKELRAVDLETGREEILFVGAFREIDVAPDGSAVAFCFGRGHVSMGLAVLGLEPPSEPGGLPTAIGEPEYVVRTEGTWHVHFGGWSPDSRKLVYVRDWDYGDIYELVERR